MKTLKIIVIVFAWFAASHSTFAKIKLPSIFGDGMVLQQQTNVKLWGSGTINKTITIWTSWNGKKYEVSSDEIDGMWQTEIETPIAGGPFSITIDDGEKMMLNDVLIGEVWLCSGQSNMGMPMKGLKNQPVLGANKAIATSSNKNLRFFSVKNDFSLEPKENVAGEWVQSKPETVQKFSATAYFFGRLLENTLDIPIGLIDVSVGGSRIEAWMSEDYLKYYKWVDISNAEEFEQSRQKRKLSKVIYNGMLYPIIGYGIRGAIWYQGEANVNDSKHYEVLLKGMVQNWRSKWSEEFPFYYVQLAPYVYGQDNNNGALLREAQLEAQNSIPNSGMACLLDLGDANTIHPPKKEEVGERLAYIALAKTYQMNGVAFNGPVLRDFKVDGSQVHLTFEYAENGLTSFGKGLNNFKLAGTDKKFHKALAKITKNGITLTCDKVKKPVAVRYAFENYVEGDLFNNAGLPASSFRTDDWED